MYDIRDILPLLLVPIFNSKFEKELDKSKYFKIGTITRDRKPVIHLFQGTNRNAPCPCGSGKKYKKCCIDKIQEEQ